ncbi:MAG: hypothetical protein N2515_00735 [Deltaproteobacteria bacterium]|nr:hypothetical protein [Deltaproteobacteria bacterium]
MKTNRLFLGMIGILLSGCAPESSIELSRFALDDPLGLLDDVRELRLFVFSASTHSCEDATRGTVVPEVPTDTPPGRTPGAIADLLLPLESKPVRQAVSVSPGSYVAYVRGKGDDRTSGLRNVVIAQACAKVENLAAGESRSVVLRLVPVVNQGVCEDNILSPDEQCTTPMMGDCDAMCRTIPFDINMRGAGVQEQPRGGGTIGNHRSVVTFLSERVDVMLRLLGPDGQPLSMPELLREELSLNDALTSSGVARLLGVPVRAIPSVAPNGRIAIAAVTRQADDFNVRVVFFDQGLMAEGPPVSVTEDAGRQEAVSGAFASNGAYVAAWVDERLGGIAVRAFSPGSNTPQGPSAALVARGGTAPAIAGLSDGTFALAFEQGGKTHFIRLNSDGSPTTGAEPAFPDGTQSQSAIAALPGGGFVIVARDPTVDGSGGGIRARIWQANGTATAPFVVNSRTQGEQSSPAVAAHEDRIAFVYESEGGIRARFVDLTGTPALNRERPPTLDDFVVAPVGTEPTIVASGSGPSATWLFAWKTREDGFGDIRGRRIPR